MKLAESKIAFFEVSLRWKASKPFSFSLFYYDNEHVNLMANNFLK